MSDLIAQNSMTGNAAFAYSLKEGPGWHGKGVAIPPEEARDPAAIAARAGAAYEVYKAPVSFIDSDGKVRTVPNREAIVRRDTQEPLEVLSGNKYNLVQPVEYFEAFRDALARNDLEISSAGVLKGGRIVFVNALLKGDGMTVGDGTDASLADTVHHYLCMGGGYDGSLSSFGFLSSLRTVCWNTLSANLSRNAKGKTLFRIPHSAPFDGVALGAALGMLGAELKVEAHVFNRLAGYRMTQEAVARFFCDTLEIAPEDVNRYDATGKHVLSTKLRNQLNALADAFLTGPGSHLPSAAGTAWGAVNAVTHWVDHVAATRDTTQDGADAARFASAQFGSGAATKARAVALAMKAAGIEAAELIAA
jgi:phage/plasmid-like protein (TIGR03299 family)